MNVLQKKWLTFSNSVMNGKNLDRENMSLEDSEGF